MADLGWAGMAGAGGVADAMSTLFNQRMEAAKLAAQQQEWQQTHEDNVALMRQRAAETAAEHRDAEQQRRTTQARLDFPLLPTSGLTQSDVDAQTSPSGGNLPSALFPIQPPPPMKVNAPPSSILAPGDPGTPETIPMGIIANSPAPNMIRYNRTLTPAEQTAKEKQDEEQRQYDTETAYINSLPQGSSQRQEAEFAQAFKRNPNAQFSPAGAKPELKMLKNGTFSWIGPTSASPAVPGPGGQPVVGSPPMLAVPTGTNEAPTVTVVPRQQQVINARTPKPTAEQTSNKDALDTLGQLDKAINDAEDLIGPGSGQVTSLEQLAGMADPRAQALGVKMLAAKLRVDRAITGSVRAGASGPLLAKWDNILANKVTPDGLRAGVQALREIIQGSSNSGATSGGATPKRTRYDVNGNPIKEE